MSTFGGQMSEFPHISVDRFDGINLQSKVFFLSHCHQDHMQGLNIPEGLPGPLYLSHISAVILRHQYSNIRELICLDIGVPTVIKCPNEDGSGGQLTVTTMPAVHCPGSVMFLFEKGPTKVLYTGDFRIRLKDLQKYQALKDSASNPIELDALYIDSTFLDIRYSEFPSQFESNSIVANLIEQWLARGDDYSVVLILSARHGYEFLLQHIAQKCQNRIHVNDGEFEKYKFIPELDNCFSVDCQRCRIHACFTNRNHTKKNAASALCRLASNKSKFVRFIKPSAAAWMKWECGQSIYRIDNGMYRVCYSNHSSLNEIRDLICYLKPKNVKLNVVPGRPLERECMMNTLNEILLEFNSETTFAELNLNQTPIRFDNVSFNERVERTNLENILLEDNDTVEVPTTLLKRRKTNALRN